MKATLICTSNQPIGWLQCPYYSIAYELCVKYLDLFKTLKLSIFFVALGFRISEPRCLHIDYVPYSGHDLHNNLLNDLYHLSSIQVVL